MKQVELNRSGVGKNIFTLLVFYAFLRFKFYHFKLWIVVVIQGNEKHFFK